MNKVLFDKIQNRLKEIELRFDTSNDLIRVGMNVEGVVGRIMEFVQVIDDAILSIAVLNNKVPTERIADVSEYLHRANLGLLYGNFELDCDDGLIRYKLLTTCQNSEKIPNSYIDRSVLLPCQMFQKYGSGAIQLMVGAGNPKDLIEKAEKE